MPSGLGIGRINLAEQSYRNRVSGTNCMDRHVGHYPNAITYGSRGWPTDKQHAHKSRTVPSKQEIHRSKKEYRRPGRNHNTNTSARLQLEIQVQSVEAAAAAQSSTATRKHYPRSLQTFLHGENIETMQVRHGSYLCSACDMINSRRTKSCPITVRRPGRCGGDGGDGGYCCCCRWYGCCRWRCSES